MKQRRIGLRATALVILSVAALGVGGGFAIHVLGSGGGSSSPSNPAGLHGQATWEPESRPAPDFLLRDQSGHRVSLASFRGDNVLLAFLSSGCRLTCAREARFLGTALRLLPPSARPALLVVSVDPLHDTPASTRAAAARCGLAAAANWHWLLGSRDQLAPVWRSYSVETGRGERPAHASSPGRSDAKRTRLGRRPPSAILISAVFSQVFRGLRSAGSALTLCLLAAGAAVALFEGCGGSGSAATSPQGRTSEGQQTTSGAKYAGIAAVPLKPAPPLALGDSLGHPINLHQYRGKAVFITFIYDHCPDVCPLIVGNLHTALAQLGPDAQKLQLIAVSVDPRGDTPKTVRAFLQAHRMSGRMEYLIGSRPRLERVWRAWHILSKSSSRKAGPDLVEHSALVYGISASGKITTLYPSNFRPGQIVHDVPILASE